MNYNIFFIILQFIIHIEQVIMCDFILVLILYFQYLLFNLTRLLLYTLPISVYCIIYMYIYYGLYSDESFYFRIKVTIVSKKKKFQFTLLNIILEYRKFGIKNLKIAITRLYYFFKD